MMSTSYRSSLNIVDKRNDLPYRDYDDDDDAEQLKQISDSIYRYFISPLLVSDFERVHGNMTLLSEKIYVDLKRCSNKSAASKLLMLFKLVKKCIEFSEGEDANAKSGGEGSIATFAVTIPGLRLKPEYELYHLLFRGYDKSVLEERKDDTLKFLREFLKRQRRENKDYKTLKRELMSIVK